MNKPWITFNIDSQLYCCDAITVKEAITYRPANPIPGAPVWVEGMINIRGDFISVFNGQALYGNNSNTIEPTRILLLEQNSTILAVSVESVEEIVYFSDEEIDTSSASTEASIQGTVRRRNELIIVVDLFELCAKKAQDEDFQIS